ncbi:ribonuclease E activity regulator RraA [Pseudonocardia sp. ICBG1122]|nr:ribonuclease E activity regulator RraA [Pseudonocardia pini]
MNGSAHPQEPAATPVVLRTADLYDEHGEALDSCDTRFRQFGAVHVFSGVVATVQVHDENFLVKEAVAEPGQGRVLVVDGGGSCHSALLGDNMARQARDNGWAGLIVHGAVRDAEELGSIAIGLKAVGTNPRRSHKVGTGRRDVPVGFGGATFRPGDVVVSDEDGIVVIRQ